MKTHIRIILFVLAALALLFCFLYYLDETGRGQEIDKTYEATILLEDGTDLPCKVRITGNINLKKGDESALNGGYDGGIFINEQRVLGGYPFWDTGGETVPLGSPEGVYYLNKSADVFAAKINVQMIMPELPPQIGYVILNDNTPEQYQPILDMLKADTREVLS